MKADTTFLLESAAWPAFHVDASGTIRHANQAAIGIFGPKLEGETVSLSAIWVDAQETVEQFLARWERTPTAVIPIRYAVKGGAVVPFATRICSSRETQRRYVFQLIAIQSTSTPMPASPLSAPAAGTSPKGGLEARPNAGSAGAQSLAELEFMSGPARPPGGEAGTQQKQKLDGALRLARTVALDFNNALTCILGHTSLLLDFVERDHPWRDSLAEIEKAAHKAAEMTHHLAQFSRQEKDVDGRAAGNLNGLLRRAVENLQHSRPAKVSWSLQLERQLYASKFDEGKMQQALARVIENSLDALGESGNVVITTRNLEFAEPVRDGAIQLSPGSYVCVEVQDDGPGIDPSVLPKIFEPFFTTKDGHRGLGLAFVYGIVTNHRGAVAVSSQKGRGTQARIYLPATRRLMTDSEAALEELRGSQTVLMVDDEELLLTMGQSVLTRFGYRVLTAKSARRALEVLEESNAPVDLVITDLAMPEMSGHELMELLQLRLPGVPVLCMSGYTRSAEAAEDAAFLPKPFTSRQLLTRVRELLGPPDPGNRSGLGP